MSATMMDVDLNRRVAAGAGCAVARNDRRWGHRAALAARPVRPCRCSEGPRVDDSVMVRRLDLIEARSRGLIRPRSAAAELRAAAREAAAQAKGERVVFAILATGSVALLAAAMAQSVQFVAQWTAFVELVAGMLA